MSKCMVKNCNKLEYNKTKFCFNHSIKFNMIISDLKRDGVIINE